jgi:hypothetical protein
MRMRNGLWSIVVGGVVGALLWAAPVGAQPFPGGLPECVRQLNSCNDALDKAQSFPATGQTSCWDSSGSPISCMNTGQDGDIQAGATLSYTDNGDGTITDNNTGLVWEKKSDDGTIHDKDTSYTWANAFAVHIAGLNTVNFAGHNDWRLPNIKELQSIVNYQNFNPAVSSEFNNNCVAACSVTTCSCTAAVAYWSSTSFAGGPSLAWGVNFIFGGVGGKSGALRVRAVRGGQ